MKIEIYEKRTQGIKGMINLEDKSIERMDKFCEVLNKEFKNIDIVKHEVVEKPNNINSLISLKREKEYITKTKVINGLMNLKDESGEVLNYDILPIVMINRHVVKVGSYPTINEVKNMIEEENKSLASGI